MLESAAKVVQAGAQLLICPTTRFIRDSILSASVPRRRWIHIAEKFPTRRAAAGSSGWRFSERAS